MNFIKICDILKISAVSTVKSGLIREIIYTVRSFKIGHFNCNQFESCSVFNAMRPYMDSRVTFRILKQIKCYCLNIHYNLLQALIPTIMQTRVK